MYGYPENVDNPWIKVTLQSIDKISSKPLEYALQSTKRRVQGSITIKPLCTYRIIFQPNLIDVTNNL